MNSVEGGLKELCGKLSVVLLYRPQDASVGTPMKLYKPYSSWLTKMIPEVDAREELLLSDLGYYLESLATEIETELKEQGKTSLISHGPWQETLDDGTVLSLYLQATSAPPYEVFLIKHDEIRFQQEQQYLQTARENTLLLERIQKSQEQMKSLLDCVSHDLMGPLTNIKTTLQLVTRHQDSIDEEQKKQFFELIFQQIDQQQEMIKELVQSSKEQYQKNQIRSVIEGVSLHEILNSMCQYWKSKADFQKVELVVEPPSQDFLLAIPSVQLHRVLNNLLSNALRFAPPNSAITFSTQLHQEEEEKELTIKICDEGPGVAPELIPNLFDKFKTHHKKREKAGMAGLGLYSCRNILRQLYGDISYRPNPKGGACFLVTVPLKS